MSKHYYRLLIDSPTGRQLTAFWRSCVSVERLADKYAKRMGGRFFYPDPRYFAGGVSYISFPDNRPQDPAMWREVATQYADGTTAFADGTLLLEDGSSSRLDGPYKGATNEADVVYFEPNVRKRLDWVEIPTREYRPADTFDCIHSSDRVMEKKDEEGAVHYFLQCCRFVFNEAPGRSGNGQRTASRTVRRAIKAEVQRTKLPVIGVEPLLGLLGADLQPEDGRAGKGVSTPTFFSFEHHYFIGCDYACGAKDLRDITPQQYRTACDRRDHAEKAGSGS